MKENTCKKCGGVLIYGNPAANDEIIEHKPDNGGAIGRLLNSWAWADERGFMRHSSYKARLGSWFAEPIKRGKSIKWRKIENLRKRRGKWCFWSEINDIPF